MLELSCLMSCLMMLKWINRQPEYKTFENYPVTIKISMTNYHHYNKELHNLCFIFTQQSVGEREYGETSQL